MSSAPLLQLRHSSFCNPSVALPMAQPILQPFRCFTYVQFILQPFFRFLYVTRSLSNLFVTSSTSQLILQPFRRFTYVKTHSPTLPLLHLRHSSFYNPCPTHTCYPYWSWNIKKGNYTCMSNRKSTGTSVHRLYKYKKVNSLSGKKTTFTLWLFFKRWKNGTGKWKLWWRNRKKYNEEPLH